MHNTRQKRLAWMMATAFAFTFLLSLAESAEARGRGRRGPSLRGGFSGYGYSGYYGHYGYYGPALYSHYGLYGYGPASRLRPRLEGGLHPATAQALELGAIDLQVKPRKAEVFVDGTYIGTAGDFDGYPQYLWLKEGEHTLTLHRGGFVTHEQTFEIKAGGVESLRLKMEKGASGIPGKSTSETSERPSQSDQSIQPTHSTSAR